MGMPKIRNEMKTVEKLQEIMTYYEASRQAGHTTLMKQGTDNYKGEKLILVHSLNAGTDLGYNRKELVSWGDLSKLRGNKKPLAIDNGTMWSILRDTIHDISILEEENRDMQAKLDVIRKIVK